MPLIVKDGKVVYKKPTVDEMPKIGRYANLNPIFQMHLAHAHIRNLSESMSVLQRSLIPGALTQLE
jgi:hypothetical protein